MDNAEKLNNPEATEDNPWIYAFEIISRAAKDRLSDHGRKRPGRAIDRQSKLRHDVKIRITSTNIDSWFTLKIKPSRDNHEKEDIRPPKGVNLAWATGEDENYLEATFTITRLGVAAYGLPMAGTEEEVRLDLVNDAAAARQLEDLAVLAVDQGKLPHLFS